MASQGPPSTSCKCNSSKRIKQEGETHLKGLKLGFAAPLYAAIPALGDGGPISRKEFVDKYELCCEVLSPKHVKVPQDISLEDITNIFGRVANKNCYNYEFTKDLVFIQKVEKLWMVVHKKKSLICQHQG